MTRQRTCLVLLATTVVTMVAACASNRTPERSFATRAEAEAAGMFDAAGVEGKLVPASAEQLRERRDLDDGEIWARFEFASDDAPAVEAHCQRTLEARLPGSVTRGIGWWPELLRTDVANARQQFEIYACRDASGRDAHLAVHRAMPTAFYWRSR